VTLEGNRKFVLALIVVGVAVFMRWRGLLADEGTVTLILAAALGYPVGSVADNYVRRSTVETPKP
jgi:drug/metabolite transporter (DMT)-like permease